jgi:hypothetical protein
MVIILFFVVGAVPPLRWGLRIALALVLLLLFDAVSASSPYNPDGGYGLFRAVSSWGYVIILASIALRGVVEFGALGDIRPAGADRLFLTAFDAALKFSLGILVGYLIFRALAIKLQGSDGGLVLHLQVAGAAATLGIIAPLLLRNRWSAPFIGAGLTVAGLAMDGGFRYPDLILSQANRIWPDQARCLMVGADLHAPKSRSDLMALTLQKVSLDPSAIVLLVQADSGPRLFRWSFRQRSFVGLSHNANDTRFCTPTLSTLHID